MLHKLYCFLLLKLKELLLAAEGALAINKRGTWKLASFFRNAAKLCRPGGGGGKLMIRALYKSHLFFFHFKGFCSYDSIFRAIENTKM